MTHPHFLSLPLAVALLATLFFSSCQPQSPKASPSASDEQQQEQQAGLSAAQPLKQSPRQPLEWPAPLKDRAEQILVRDYYTVSYNADTKQPNWVAWRLTKAHTYGDEPRPQRAFHEDEDVAKPRATFQDYSGTKWSRGHMCPAGDNKWDKGAMYETFLMTNICPQDFDLNDGLWNEIEMTCRQWARKYGEVFIVCGPLFTQRQHRTIGRNKIPVPEAFFKVVLCMRGKPKAIGFVCRNSPEKGTQDQYVKSIDEVERLTGIDFFPAVDDDIESSIEGLGRWKDW